MRIAQWRGYKLDQEGAASRYGCPDSTSPNAVMSSQLTTREAGKCSLGCTWEEKAMGFGEHIADSDTEIQVSLLSPYPQRVTEYPEGYRLPILATIGLGD